MKKPIVSVIMGVYNKERFLEESVDSVLNQTLKDFEIIMIDDQSKDNSWKIMRRLAKKDKRVIAIKNKQNLGSTTTRNVALKIARGKYIAILDADDVMYPRRLEKQVKYLERHPHIFLVGTSARFIDESGKLLRTFWKWHRLPIIVSKRLDSGCVFVHSSIMFRNDGTKYNEKYKRGEDWEFYLRARKKGKKMLNLFLPLTKYRRDPNGIMSKMTPKNDIYKDMLIKEYIKDDTKTN
ncbi:Glycosyltransferase AglE [uncultured archaeon]|nr:Glycosyltransferase AglE [uncultured archaeon]